jgi:hypothetical protein
MTTPAVRSEDLHASWRARNTAGFPVSIAVAAPEEERFAHLSWNKVLRTPKGTVLLAYTAGTFHGDHGGGSPAVSRSTDSGLTFSPPQVLREFGPGLDYTQSGNTAIGLSEDGSAILLLAMAYTGDVGNHIFGWRSEDEGATWNRVDTSALGPNKTGSVFGRIVPVEGHGLAALGYYRKGSEPHTQGIWISNSKDAGRTWNSPRLIADIHAVEPALVATSNGRLLGFFRGESKVLRGRQYVGVSDDKGSTWKTGLSVLDSEDRDKSRLAAPFAVENPERPGEILVLTTERGVAGPSQGRIWLWRGDAEKLDWKRDRILLVFPFIPQDIHTDFGYPWLLHIEADRWLMYYYHGEKKGPSPIWVTEVRL